MEYIKNNKMSSLSPKNQDYVILRKDKGEGDSQKNIPEKGIRARGKKRKCSHGRTLRVDEEKKKHGRAEEREKQSVDLSHGRTDGHTLEIGKKRILRFDIPK